MASGTDTPNSAWREAVVSALLDSPDIVQVLRLTIVEDSDSKTLVVAASVACVDTLPTLVLAGSLLDAKWRVEEVVGQSTVYLEPDLVRDPDRDEPATDVIVIKASD